MTDETIGPATGSTISFYRAGSEDAESALVTERFDNGDTPMATLSFGDGTVLTVPMSDIQS